MKNIINNIWKLMKLSTFIFALSTLFASCSNELDEALQPAGNGNLQFVVGDFPAFGEGAQTRAIGLQDEGKTAWKDGDKILVHLYSNENRNQAVTLTFNEEENAWKSDPSTLQLRYLRDEITAVYAPDCEIKSDKTIGLIDGKQYGMAEYILAQTSISGNTLDIRFESGRTYSRLRFASMPGATLTVTTGNFTPAGPNGTTAPESYTLTTDDDGNAYLYGTFAINGTVTATANHEIYPEEGITEISRTSAFDDSPSTSGQSYVLGVKLGDKVDAQLAYYGDVALKDGSFVSGHNIARMTDAQKKAIVGVVAWTVSDSESIFGEMLTYDKVMNADFPHCTHGLIVSLRDLETMTWQDSPESVAAWQETSEEYNSSKTDYARISPNSSEDVFEQVHGYQYTEILKAYNTYCVANGKSENIVKPVEALSTFAAENPVPFGSTGWYLPSARDLDYICNGDFGKINDNTKNDYVQGLNYIIGNEQLTDKSDPLEYAEYWTSMESSTNGVRAVSFNFSTSQYSDSYAKTVTKLVRYVCAF